VSATLLLNEEQLKLGVLHNIFLVQCDSILLAKLLLLHDDHPLIILVVYHLRLLTAVLAQRDWYVIVVSRQPR